MGLLKSFSLKLDKNQKWIVFGFFFLFFLVGILIYRDYGMSVDAVAHKLIGEESFNYIFHGDQEIFSDPSNDHGAAFDLSITYLYKLLNLQTDVQIYSFRHLAGFILFFIATIFFYLLLNLRFKDWRIGLLGTLFLILSPRMFENAFINPKDSPFMALSIISLYTLFKLDEKMRFRDAIIHGAVTGYMLAIRPLGMLMVAMTGLIWLIRLVIGIKNHSKPVGRHLAVLGSYLAMTALFTCIWWPWLWPDPIGNFMYSFISFSQYSKWIGQVIYMGTLYEPTQLPWHYTPVWIAVTTPLLYTFMFLIGVFFVAKGIIRQKFNLGEFLVRYDLVILGWFMIPLVTVAVLHSVLYSGWRHMYFIYPAMLVLSVTGLVSFNDALKNQFNTRLFQSVLRITVILSLVGTTASMIVNHPYEELYFTILAGKNMKSAKFRYGLDYYGVCAKEALDYVMNTTGQEQVKIFPNTAIVRQNAFLIPWDIRSRIEWVGDYNIADYFVGAYQKLRSPFIVPDSYKLVYPIQRGGVDICVVYKSMDER